MLVAEYENKYVLVHAHIHTFAELPIMKTENESDLKRLRDTIAASVAALRNLGCLVDYWNDLLVYFVFQKFSAKTWSEWNLKRSDMTDVCPTYKSINEFMTFRIRGLTDYPAGSEPAVTTSRGKNRASINNIAVAKCVMDNCFENHPLFKCMCSRAE